MCGRFSYAASMDLLIQYLGVQKPTWNFSPRYNIAPSQYVMVVVSDGGARYVNLWKWGLIPGWSKDTKIAYSTINARAETVFEKPTFRHSIHKQRCLIPADGFYEWRKDGTTKQPMRIILRDRPVFSFAGIYDFWTDPEGQVHQTVSIITTSANDLMSSIHERMPVILPTHDEKLWLDPEIQDRTTIEPLLTRYPSHMMRAFPVSDVVNNTRNDIPECAMELNE